MMNFNLVGRLVSLLFFSIFLFSFKDKDNSPYVVVLGVAQDGGAPHAACEKTCCINKWNNPNLHNKVSSIGIVDPVSNEVWMIDATPDFAEQLHFLTSNNIRELKGIFLTHAHIGHYTGLMHLGREVMGAKSTVVNVMPKMESFLRNNGPWSQLVDLKNISLSRLIDSKKVYLNTRLSITPFKVPHRDEFSETVGYRIEGPSKSLVFIPDIDKWNKWQTDIIDIVENSDYSLLDGTFYDINELPGRDMSQIPHPFIVETMKIFKNSDKKDSIFFIHLNHTNPALDNSSNEFQNIIDSGFNITQRGNKLNL
jgi:pyrroloquinoline quinone biosynthesis protein B